MRWLRIIRSLWLLARGKIERQVLCECGRVHGANRREFRETSSGEKRWGPPVRVAE